MDIQVEHRRAAEMVRAVEEERASVRKLRDRLEAMIGQVEKMLEPIRAYASSWFEASPLRRQAMGAKGPDAARIASSEQVRELEVMKTFMSGRGAGRQ